MNKIGLTLISSLLLYGCGGGGDSTTPVGNTLPVDSTSPVDSTPPVDNTNNYTTFIDSNSDGIIDSTETISTTYDNNGNQLIKMQIMMAL